ncbi:alginate O-acetyltransferase AlgX-related protein [Murimonas intestini]|uniref:Acetyltransferase AlgX (SGNH hydrolase-like protein) n=1 Tax=Murimonas intestini TaxID=1337051 RepID=A0AB73T8X7_9FIRM|nr:hypothetical protein [Murimonas intestini]MCR1839457.1 hypothetical protein [Murimonas intestini]MCR1864752.1 hypothetical protein [Murimonas intestini]MCR1882362.1 hypothetical protein [Murimonas intestini]
MKQKIITGIFLCFIFSYLILDPVSRSVKVENTENRNLAVRPELSIDTYSDYAGEFEAYYDDYIPFRKWLKKIEAVTKKEIFHTTSNPAVILGKEGWLFYNSKEADKDTDSLKDYSGELYTREQLGKIVEEVEKAYDYCKERDMDFVFLIGPNKESVYNEYMPDAYRPLSDYTRTVQAVDYILENTEIPCIYPREELKSYKEKYPLYYKTDTHWNALGGYVAAMEISEKFRLGLPDISEISYSSKVWTGDLLNLLGTGVMMDDSIYFMDNKYKVKQTDYDQERLLAHYETEAPGGKNVLVLGDSFSDALVQPLGQCFSRMTFLRSRYYEWADVEDYDLVVYELVERSISLLAR